MTIFHVIDDQSPVSTRRNITKGLVAEAPWIKVPYPGEVITVNSIIEPFP